jgi:hypothetical protein
MLGGEFSWVTFLRGSALDTVDIDRKRLGRYGGGSITTGSRS